MTVPVLSHDPSVLAHRLTSLAAQPATGAASSPPSLSPSAVPPPVPVPRGNPSSTSFQTALLLRTSKLSEERWKRAREEVLDSEILQKRFAGCTGRAGEAVGEEGELEDLGVGEEVMYQITSWSASSASR